MGWPDDPIPTDGVLQRLADMLGDAAEVAGEIARDDVLRRLIEAFRLMPIEDRETIVTAIEREVHARRLSCATEEATGQSMHPNPHARLYLRMHEQPMPRSLLEREELMLAMLRGMRVATLLGIPEIHESWVAGTREALEHIDAPTRELVGTLLREVLDLVQAAAVESPPSGQRASTG